MCMKICRFILLCLLLAMCAEPAFPQAVKVAKRAAAKAAAKYGTRSAAKGAAATAAVTSFSKLAKERAMHNAPAVSSYVVRKGIRGEGAQIVRNSAKKVFADAAAARAESLGKRRLLGNAVTADEPVAVLRRKRYNLSVRKPMSRLPANTKREVLPSSSLASEEIKSVCDKFNAFDAKKFKMRKMPNGSVAVSYPGHSTSAVFSADGEKIMARGGSRTGSFSQNEFLNNTLPNKTYVVDEHAVYKTDGRGRTSVVCCDESALYKAGEKEARTGRPSFKPLLEDGYGVSNSKYDGGHLVSYANNGSHEKINVIPMESEWQRHGAWAKFERERQKAVKAGKSVFTQMKVDYYDDAPSIPQKIAVETWIDGKKITKVFSHPHP